MPQMPGDPEQDCDSGVCDAQPAWVSGTVSEVPPSGISIRGRVTGVVGYRSQPPLHHDLEAQVAVETRAIAALEAARQEPIRLPSPSEIEARVLDLHRLAKESPVEAREALRAIFKDGRIVMHPQADGTYIARTEILPLVLVAPRNQKPRQAGPGGVVYTGWLRGGDFTDVYDCRGAGGGADCSVKPSFGPVCPLR
jgi:hypothetical protein